MATEIVIHIFKMLITVRADTLLHCGKDFLTVMPTVITELYRQCDFFGKWPMVTMMYTYHHSC